MITHHNNIDDISFFVTRALSGQTPPSLQGYSYAVDKDKKIIHFRAHYNSKPSEKDRDDVSVVESEIMSDFLDQFTIESDYEISSDIENMHPLVNGFIWKR